ncbi:PepSY-associated TM helix domain-containing protein [Echinicola vietnamensis]|uniref:Putative iron-regulated membrane protein n=1 Tax=Echinicola vietnamensis (strain DSM 17526 / LMG 23754 / KMM 6221) TaxID=926556 RepID=L0G4F3_ECHVK|nr:PepSY-associated TM helix domain-containing protein [Echinicola vietnamensis]AGA80412.1 putative iron-regulated membrane protein [Echinicola vietnamensis DSM 17526]
MKAKKQKTTWQKVRKFFNDIHLWVGLASALVLIPVCFSGTIYVYNTELQEMFSAHLHHIEIQNGSSKKTIESLLQSLSAQVDGDITGVSVPHDPQGTFQFTVREKDSRSRFGTSYYMDPYTGKIVGTSEEKNAIAGFMRDMFSLHRWLLLDKIEEPLIGELSNRKLGSYITGTATILFTLGVLTGIVIWFPQKVKNWRQGLKLKLNGSWKRANHDLHNTLAFYAFFILLIMGLTGPQWSFPWYRTGLQKTLGTYQEPSGRGGGHGRPSPSNEKEEQPEKTLSLLPYQEYLDVADKHLDYTGDYRISFPKNGNDLVEIQKNKTGFFAPAASDRISLEPATAAVSDIHRFADQPFNQRVARSIKALHIGSVYGGFSKLLYFISCLIATSLPITGTLIWINKMKKKPSRKTKKKPQAVAVS